MGEHIDRPPSEMENYIAIPPKDFAAFSGWCYDANQKLVEHIMEYEIRRLRDEEQTAIANGQ